MRSSLLLTLTSITILITSCSSPDSLMKPKGYLRSMPYAHIADGRGSGRLFGTASFNHGEFTAAYSPIDNVNVQALGYAGLRGWTYDLGGSIYANTGPVHFQFMAGVGAGQVDTELKTCCGAFSVEYTQVSNEAVYDKVFFQPTVAFRLKPGHRLGLMARQNLVHYDSFDRATTGRPYQSRYPGGRPDLEFTDLAVTFTDFAVMGSHEVIGRLALDWQIGMTYDDYSGPGRINYESGFVNLGLAFDFGRK